MALNFPSSPTNGQTYTYGSITYYYDSANIAWTTTYAAPPSIDFTPANNWANTVGTNANTYANATFYTSTNGASAFGFANGVATNAASAFAKANTSVQNNTTTLISTGYTVLTYNAGVNVAAFTTWTPDPANGNYQFANSNGTFTIAAPTNNCAIDILFTNGQGGAGNNAGSITFSGFTAPSGGGGDTYVTTANNKFILMIRKINSIATYSWKALQ